MADSSRAFIQACRQQSPKRIPVWMMRQAGRYQKEYRALKERVGGFWNLCNSPEAIAEATVFAQQQLDTDAAIIFSDITVPSWAMGMDLEFAPGPKFGKPIREASQIEALRDIIPDQHVPFLRDGIKLTRSQLPDSCSLIGFIGAPVTVCAYMIEGYPSRNWVEFKKMMYGQPKLFERLLDRVAENLIVHAKAQVAAGCDCIQMFDSSAGLLSSAELHKYCFGYSKKVIDGIKDLGVPVIYFARDIGAHLETAAGLGADVLGVDWTVSITEVRKRLGDNVALQGNLDPACLFLSGDEVERRTLEILEQAKGLPGFIFNLGHGILVETPPENAKRVVETVHRWSEENLG